MSTSSILSAMRQEVGHLLEKEAGKGEALRKAIKDGVTGAAIGVMSGPASTGMAATRALRGEEKAIHAGYVAGKAALPVGVGAAAYHAGKHVGRKGAAKEKVANVINDAAHAAGSSAGRGAAGRLGAALKNSKHKAVAAIGEHFSKHDHKYDLGGLGLMSAVTGNELRHAAKDGDRTGVVHAGGELAGLAALAAPVAAKMLAH